MSDILISGRNNFLFWNYFMGFKRAYGSHDTGKACISPPKRLSHSDTRYFSLVQPALAHLRSADEIAMNPAITLNINEVYLPR